MGGIFLHFFHQIFPFSVCFLLFNPNFDIYRYLSPFKIILVKTWMIEVLDTPFLRLTKIILEEKWHFFNYFFKKMPILYENGCTLVMFYINRHPVYTMDSDFVSFQPGRGTCCDCDCDWKQYSWREYCFPFIICLRNILFECVVIRQFFLEKKVFFKSEVLTTFAKT